MKRTINNEKTIGLIAVSFFVIVILLPLIITLVFPIIKIRAHPALWQKETFVLFCKSAFISGVVATISTSLGLLISFLLGRTGLPFNKIIRFLLLAPLLISPYIFAVAWKDVFLFLFRDTAFIYSSSGVILVFVFIFTPLAVLILENALININARLEEASITITTALNSLLHISLRLIKPAIISSWILIFVLSISEFSVPAIYGVDVLTTEIFTQFAAFYNHDLAILQSLLIVIICILLLSGESSYLSDAPFFTINPQENLFEGYKIRGRYPIVLTGLICYIFISLFLPLIILCRQSFQGGFEGLREAWKQLQPVIGESLLYAVGSSFLICLLGLIYAIAVERGQQKYISILLLITFAIPSTVLGISVIKFYNTSYFSFIYGSGAILLIGLFAKLSFVAVKVVGNAFKQLPGNIEDAARLSGAGTYQLWRYIIFPILFKPLSVAFMLVFILSLGELGYSIMVYPPGTSLMPIKIFTIMANAPASLVSGMVLISLLISLTALFSLFILQRTITKKTEK